MRCWTEQQLARMAKRRLAILRHAEEITGNVALSDGPNVTTGERIVYDLNTSIANVETNPGGRVRGLFVPGSNPEIGGSGGTSGPAKPQGRPPQTN